VARAGGVVYIKQANAGLCAARNAGIAAASGKYFLFLDADDLLAPEALAWLIEAMDGRSDRLCVMGYRLFERDANRGEDRHLPSLPALPRLFFDNLAPPHAYLCSRPMLDAAGGFDPKPKGCEDWDLWLRMALAGCQLQTVPRIGAYYRRYSGSMSTDPEQMELATIMVLSRAIERVRTDDRLLQQWGGQINHMRRRVGRANFDVGYHRTKRGAARSAIGAYVQSIRYGFGLSPGLAGMAKAIVHAAKTRDVLAPPQTAR
jgi:glycosyltransferase involved in cell wall biosynthesis